MGLSQREVTKRGPPLRGWVGRNLKAPAIPPFRGGGGVGARPSCRRSRGGRSPGSAPGAPLLAWRGTRPEAPRRGTPARRPGPPGASSWPSKNKKQNKKQMDIRIFGFETSRDWTTHPVFLFFMSFLDLFCAESASGFSIFRVCQGPPWQIRQGGPFFNESASEGSFVRGFLLPLPARRARKANTRADKRALAR